jgi:hypothetical protein
MYYLSCTLERKEYSCTLQQERDVLYCLSCIHCNEKLFPIHKKEDTFSHGSGKRSTLYRMHILSTVHKQLGYTPLSFRYIYFYISTCQWYRAIPTNRGTCTVCCGLESWPIWTRLCWITGRCGTIELPGLLKSEAGYFFLLICILLWIWLTHMK